MQVQTQKQIKVTQTRIQKTADQLNQEVVVVTQGKQHIQVQAGIAYRLSTKNSDTQEANLIAKKVGNDLEVFLEDSVVVFDNYFEVCTTGLSCLVSLPTEDGGLYHIVADVFFTLEDGTQIVYFYGEQSIISTESSAIDMGDNQSFMDVITSNIGIVAAVVVAAVVVAGSSSDNDDGDNNFFVTLVAGPVLDNTGIKIAVYDKDGKFIAEGEKQTNGRYKFNKSKMSGIVIFKAYDTDDTVDYQDEKGDKMDLDIALLAVVNTEEKSEAAITVLTTIAAKQAGITDDGKAEAGGIAVSSTVLTDTIVNAKNKGVGKAFGIDDITNVPKAVIDKDGKATQDADAYGQVLAAVSGAGTIKDVVEKYDTTGEWDAATKDGIFKNVVKQEFVNGAAKVVANNDEINDVPLNTALTSDGSGGSITAEALVTITSNKTGTAVGEIIFTFTFSPALIDLSDFTVSDIVIAGGTAASSFKTGATTTVYELIVTPNTDTEGNITISIAGKSGKYASAINFIQAYDVKTPAAPESLALAAIDDTGSSDSDNITNKGTVTITGKAEAGSTVELFNGTTLLGEKIIVDNSGNFSKEVTLATNATTNITAKATDTAGNTSLISSALSISVDSTDPTFTSSNAGAGIANQNNPVYDAEVDGGDANVKYTLRAVDLVKFNINVDTGIVVYKTIPGITTDNIVITATDIAGNAKTHNVEITVMDKPIVAITSNKPNGTNGAFELTFTFTEQVSGFEVDDIIFTSASATNDKNISTGALTTASSGTDHNKVFTLMVTPEVTLRDGNIAVDIAADAVTSVDSGRTNIAATQFIQKFDKTKPATPNATLTDSGSNAMDGITNDATISAPTNVETNAIVEYKINTGAWSEIYTKPTEDDIYTVKVRQTDGAGNVSDEQTIAFTLNTSTPTLAITGSGGEDTRTITFNFSEAIQDGSFTTDDIGIENGTLNAVSLTKVSASQYTAVALASLGGLHANVAITVAANTFVDLAGNANTAIAKNITTLYSLQRYIDVDGNGSDVDLTNWDVSHANSAFQAFFNAKKFNQNIGGWDVSNVTNMQSMFNSAHIFNQDIGSWNVTKVSDMTDMFRSAYNFNQNIGSWNVGNVTDMKHMFNGAVAFNQNIGSWNVGNVTNMQNMFKETAFFNQNIGSWNVGKVVNMEGMFRSATGFNQDVGSWDISSLTNAERMFTGISVASTNMDIANMDNTLRGWAKLDTAAGETTIQRDVKWSIANYTDATAKQYLIDTYNWDINVGTFDGSKTIQGSNSVDTLNTDAKRTTLHGLGGDDTLIGGTTDDILIGGAGNDLLVGGGGRDVFYYGFKNAGNDSISDFFIEGANEATEVDIIDLSNLLLGYRSTSNLSDFVTVTGFESVDTRLTIDYDGTGSSDSLIIITLLNVEYKSDFLDKLIANGNLRLNSTKPTLMITGSGGTNAITNTITFNFSKAIENESFTVDDIDIVNGTINADSFAKISETQYTVMVTPSLGVKHSNVAITVAANTFIDIAGNANASITKNTTKISHLKDLFNIDSSDSNTDLTNWNVSHVGDTRQAFSNTINFNQDIGSWDVSNVTDMRHMFDGAASFNQDIGNWNVSKVVHMHNMFNHASAFNQDIGNWDISSLKGAALMFSEASAITVDNMDNILRGWAKLDTAAGETAIQDLVWWGIANYTDATARQYLEDAYRWNINDGDSNVNFDGSKTIQGTITANTLTTTTTKTVLHGLGGDDTLIGGSTNDILVGGAGDDTLTGADGRDIFDYGFKNASNDVITDFIVGEISVNSNADIIDLSDLLIGYTTSSNLSDFLIATVFTSDDTKLLIDHDGTGELDSLVTIILENVAYSDSLLSDMIANHNLVLE